MNDYYDIEAIRARLGNTDVPVEVCMAYLQLLTNLNALSFLMSPNVDLQDEPGTAELERIIQSHYARKRRLEAEYPALRSVLRHTNHIGN